MLTATHGLAAVTITLAEEDTKAQRAGGSAWVLNPGRGFQDCAQRGGQGEMQSRSKGAVQGGPGAVYVLPVATVTSDHKLGGFEQGHFIPSQLQGPEVWR